MENEELEIKQGLSLCKTLPEPKVGEEMSSYCKIQFENAKLWTFSMAMSSSSCTSNEKEQCLEH